MLGDDSLKCKLCSESSKKAIMSAKFAHELKNVFIMISTIVSDTNKKRNSFESMVHQDSGILSPFRFDRRRANQNDISNDNASINVEDNEEKFSFLKSLCDYGKSLIKEMNKIFLEEKKAKCELFYVSDVIEFCVKMFKFKKYREGKKFKIRSDIKFSYNKAINSIITISSSVNTPKSVAIILAKSIDFNEWKYLALAQELFISNFFI